MNTPPRIVSSNVQRVHALLRDPKVTKVGWGTGACFRHSCRPDIALHYLVDNDRSRWGTTLNGLRVCAPDALRDEDPARTVVIIYSQAAAAIVPDLLSIGPFHHATIEAYQCFAATMRAVQRAASRVSAPLTAPRARVKQVVVMQGPVFAEYTIPLAKCVRALNPGVDIVLSTWDDTDPDLLDQASRCVTHVVVGPVPGYGGVQNRNRQIVSTRRGLELARELGARAVMKIRTDAAPLAPGILDACEAVSEEEGYAAAPEFGLRRRIVVPETYTRKYLLYHPSDLIAYGSLDDLCLLWSAPLDTRTFDMKASEEKAKSIADVARSGLCAESYVAISLARRIGWPLSYTLEDGWRFLRDLFIVQENRWFGLCWAKWPRLPALKTRRRLEECLSHAEWKQLASGAGAVAVHGGLDASRTCWGEFYDAGYGPRTDRQMRMAS